jgi:hypothetical protein
LSGRLAERTVIEAQIDRRASAKAFADERGLPWLALGASIDLAGKNPG